MSKTNNQQHLSFTNWILGGMLIPRNLVGWVTLSPTRLSLKFILFALFFTILLPATAARAAGSYSGGGDGLPATPFQIAEPNDLVEMSQHSEDWSKNFILTADINMNLADPNTFTTALIAPDTDNAAGYQGTSFTGKFDGQNYTIDNLNIGNGDADYDYLGLFGKVEGSEATVKNLNLTNAHITGGDYSRYIGSLVGRNYSSISNCTVAGSVTCGFGCYCLGGLVGYNEGGSISECSATCPVTGAIAANVLGGLIGWNEGPLSDCFATGAITGEVQSTGLGGLVGTNQAGGITSISNCYATGLINGGDGSAELGGLAGANGGNIYFCSSAGSVAVEGDSSNLGGLVGMNAGNINNCSAAGNVIGSFTTPEVADQLGGLVGQHYTGNINNCYATGYVTGNNILGGLVGFNLYGNISNCYATGSVTGAPGATFLGGVVAYKFSGVISQCYFLNTAVPPNGYGEPLDDPNMQIQSNFVNWDFIDSGPEEFWRMGFMSPGYPILSFQRDIPGDFIGPYGVDLFDYAYFANFWARTNCDSSNNHCSGADLNLSGNVGLPDLMHQLSHWLDGK